MRYSYLNFFFFLTCPHKGRGKEIRTNDLRFIRRDSQLIDLGLGDIHILIWSSVISLPRVIPNVMQFLKLSINQKLINHISN
jgi:hypothetical protein